MTDYDYSDYRVQLSGDSSQNTATQLSGYELDVHPDPSWPGLHADPNSQRLHTEQMLAIVDQIESLVQTLNNSDASTIAASAGVSFGPPVWAAADSLQKASEQVGKTVSQYTTDLVANLQAAADKIKSSAHGYNAAEKHNTDSATNQQRSLDPTSSKPL